MDDDYRPVIVVTGSSGYLGAAVVRRLHERYRVVGLVRSSPPHPPHQAECVCFVSANFCASFSVEFSGACGVHQK